MHLYFLILLFIIFLGLTNKYNKNNIKFWNNNNNNINKIQIWWHCSCMFDVEDSKE